jgi:hypothetical protein
MKFKEYINEKKNYSMGLSVLKKVFKDRFDTIKSPNSLDDLYNDFVQQIKKWTGYSDEEYEWIDMMFRTTAKRLKVNREYGSLKKH